MRFAAEVRSHRVILDQPSAAGGGDSGPMPIEMLGVSLGSCVALYVRQFLASRGFTYEGLRVEVESESARNPSRIGSFAVRVFAPVELSNEQLQLLDRVARSCPVHSTLAEGAEVMVEVSSPLPVAG
jgi:putative redox protein